MITIDKDLLSEYLLSEIIQDKLERTCNYLHNKEKCCTLDKEEINILMLCENIDENEIETIIERLINDNEFINMLDKKIEEHLFE